MTCFVSRPSGITFAVIRTADRPKKHVFSYIYGPYLVLVEWPRYVDAKCRMAEVCRKGTLGSVLAWRAASLLLIRLLFVLKPPLWEKEDKLQSEPVGAWLKKYTYSLLIERSSGTWLQGYSTMPRVLEIRSNILYSIGYSVGNSTHVEFSKSKVIFYML